METTVLTARVLEVRCGQLLVCSRSTGQTILVHTEQACCFSRGDWVRIEYSGAMTMSCPPQISAGCISRTRC